MEVKRIAKGLMAVMIGVTIMALFLYMATPSGKARRRIRIAVDWESVVDDQDQELEIHWLGKGRGVEGSWIEKMLEARFNVELKPIFLTPEAFLRKKPLLFAGGMIPDVCFEPPGHIRTDAHHGFLLELPYELIKEHAPAYFRKINEVDPTGWISANYKGKNYGLPLNYVKGLYPRPGIWRMDWLRNLGIDKVPVTLDEWYEALRAIRYGDPNGTGKMDTYGMSADMATSWNRSFPDVFCAFGVLPFEWVERDGKIVWGGCLPETKQALALLQAWRTEGLIDPDFVIENAKSVERKFASGRLGYVDYEGRLGSLDLKIPSSYANRLRQLDTKAELAVGAFPVGPTGHRGGRIHGGSGNAVAFGAHLAREPEKVVRVLTMFEAMATNENLAIQTLLGKRGLHWDYRDEEVGPGSGTKRLPPYEDRYRAQREAIGKLDSGSFFHPDTPGPAMMDKYTPQKFLAFRRKHRRSEWARRDALGRTSYVPQADAYLADLRRMQQIVFTEIIRGDKDVDYFETFVRNWKVQGGDILLNEANEMTARRDEIYRKVGVQR